MNVPLCYLLGGKHRDRIRVCYPLFATADDPSGEKNVARVGRLLAEGFDLFRYYCGPTSLDVDERVLQGIRQTYADRVSFKSLDMSGQCTGHPFLPINDSFVCKLPGGDVPIGWHQDPPCCIEPLREVTFSIPNFDTDIYLDDSTIENGCVWGLPGIIWSGMWT